MTVSTGFSGCAGLMELSELRARMFYLGFLCEFLLVSLSCIASSVVSYFACSHHKCLWARILLVVFRSIMLWARPSCEFDCFSYFGCFCAFRAGGPLRMGSSAFYYFSYLIYLFKCLYVVILFDLWARFFIFAWAFLRSYSPWTRSCCELGSLKFHSLHFGRAELFHEVGPGFLFMY